MNRFTAGILAGGIITAVGISLITSDPRSRRKMARDGRRAIRKAGDFVGGVTEIFE